MVEPPFPAEMSTIASARGIFSRVSVSSRGIALNTIQGGSGPLLLIAAGWPQSVYSLHKILPGLAEHFRVIAFDPPSLGDTQAPIGGYDLVNIASHLDALIDTQDCLLVGHDIGAWIAYTYASRNPSKIRRLALIDAVIPGLAPAEAYRPAPETMHRSWHFAFNFLPELPEMLITGRERQFLSWLFRTKSVDWTRAFDDAALDEYTRIYAAAGAWTGGLGYYRAPTANADPGGWRRFRPGRDDGAKPETRRRRPARRGDPEQRSLRSRGTAPGPAGCAAAVSAGLRPSTGNARNLVVVKASRKATPIPRRYLSSVDGRHGPSRQGARSIPGMRPGRDGPCRYRRDRSQSDDG